MGVKHSANTKYRTNVRTKLDGNPDHIVYMKKRFVSMQELFDNDEYGHLGNACTGEVSVAGCFVLLSKTAGGARNIELGYLPCEAIKTANWVVVPEDRPQRDGIYSWLDRRGLLKTKTDTEYDSLKAKWVELCNQYRN